jgi:CheY-like chemotaxis protein
VDTRPRILIVEDVAETRESYLTHLQLDGGYRVDAVEDLSGALEALNLKTYDAALIDIMLAGEKDMANRDGVKVVNLVRALNEGTVAVVVTANRETKLARDLLKEHGALDYVTKEELEREGAAKLLTTVRMAVGKSRVVHKTWDDVVAALAGDRSEREFVAVTMNKLDFRGGFDVLNRTLVGALQHFMPLLPLKDSSGALHFDERYHGFWGTYWSKGAGTAVRVLITGRQPADPGLDDGEEQPLLAKSKAGLHVLVTQVRDHGRSAFAGAVPAPQSLH